MPEMMQSLRMLALDRIHSGCTESTRIRKKMDASWERQNRGSCETGAAAGALTLIWSKNLDLSTFSVISGLWEVQWRATWISTILTFQG